MLWPFKALYLTKRSMKVGPHKTPQCTGSKSVLISDHVTHVSDCSANRSPWHRGECDLGSSLNAISSSSFAPPKRLNLCAKNEVSANLIEEEHEHEPRSHEATSITLQYDLVHNIASRFNKVSTSTSSS